MSLQVCANKINNTDSVETSPLQHPGVFFLPEMLEQAFKQGGDDNRPVFKYNGIDTAIGTENTKTVKKIRSRLSELSQNGLNIGDLCEEYYMAFCTKGGTIPFLKVSDNLMHVRHTNIGPIGPPADTGTETKFVTGSCMFGTSGSLGITNKNHVVSLCDQKIWKKFDPAVHGVISELQIGNQLQPYEVATLITRSSCLKKIRPNKIYTNIAHCGYLLYARDLIEAGFMDGNLIKEWDNHINLKKAQLVKLEAKINNCDVIAVDSLIEHKEIITDVQVSKADLAEKLANGCEWWKNYLSHSPPESFADFGHASYIKTYFDLLGPDATHLVAVEDQEEQKIFEQLKRSFKFAGTPNLKSRFTGLYLFGNIISTDAQGQASDLYYADGESRHYLISVMLDCCQNSFKKEQVECLRMEAGL